MKNKQFLFVLLLFLVSAMLIVASEIIQSHRANEPAALVSIAEKNLHRLENKMEAALGEISAIQSDSAFHEYFIHRSWPRYGFSFFCIEHEKITRWSDNETDIGSTLADTSTANSLVHLNNGWYEIFTRRQGDREFIGLLLIRKQYA